MILIISYQTCGTNKPSAAIKSKTNEAKIEFHSDKSVNDKVGDVCYISNESVKDPITVLRDSEQSGRQ